MDCVCFAIVRFGIKFLSLPMNEHCFLYLLMSIVF